MSTLQTASAEQILADSEFKRLATVLGVIAELATDDSFLG